MDEKPRRRWFRFRLSTVLILTAMLAMTMAMRPQAWYGYEHQIDPFGAYKRKSIRFFIWLNDDSYPIFNSAITKAGKLDNLTFVGEMTGDSHYRNVWLQIGPKGAYAGPAALMLVFIAWSVVRRRRARRTTATPVT